MNIINTTPHEIVIFNDNLEIVKVFETQNQLFILEEIIVSEMELEGIPFQLVQYLTNQDLPVIQENVYYIVSSIVQLNFPERKDFITPTDFVRDKQGQIIGAKGFRCLKY